MAEEQIKALRERMQQSIIGQEDVVERIIIGLLAACGIAVRKVIGLIVPAWSVAKGHSEVLGDIWQRLSARQKSLAIAGGRAVAADDLAAMHGDLMGLFLGHVPWYFGLPDDLPDGEYPCTIGDAREEMELLTDLEPYRFKPRDLPGAPHSLLASTAVLAAGSWTIELAARRGWATTISGDTPCSSSSARVLRDFEQRGL